MRFGYGLITCQRHPSDPRTDAELYAEALDLSVEAEELGFDSVWTSEHHFADDGYMPSLLPVSAAIAARTRRIEIGTGIALAPLYDPIRLAEDSATVDVLSGGRFILGLGLGWLDWELGAFGVELRDRVPRTLAAIRTCREAWGDGLVQGLGVSVTPKPSRPGGPPIWIGGYAEPAVRRAAALADGWIGGGSTAAEFAEALAWLRDEAAERGRAEDLVVSGYWPVFTWDAGDAWERLLPSLHHADWKYLDSEGSKGRLGPLPVAPPMTEDDEALLRATAICGRPDEVAEQIRILSEIAGSGFHFVGRFYYPGMDREVMRRSTELFAREVIPALR